jgi:hypothetical protein
MVHVYPIHASTYFLLLWSLFGLMFKMLVLESNNKAF